MIKEISYTKSVSAIAGTGRRVQTLYQRTGL